MAQMRTIKRGQDTDAEARSNTVVAKDAHKRFASPSFPPELRLQVMKAGVLQTTCCWHVGPEYTVDDVWNAALSSVLAPELWDPEKRRFNLD